MGGMSTAFKWRLDDSSDREPDAFSRNVMVGLAIRRAADKNWQDSIHGWRLRVATNGEPAFVMAMLQPLFFPY